ncbi:MAG: Gfo/Idh/MocA family oxidoreductase, partial [Armatimonadetes bacterium]|nr:Gfo/Idh/MocA family oxidoreductase [Armatimonadota bacterium]
DHFHAPFTTAALRSGKHVLCEKPMAPTWDECLEMYRASREAGRKLMIGQSYRWRQPFHAAKAAVEAGEIGEVFYVEAQYWNNLEGVGGEGNWRNDPKIRHPFIGGVHALDLTRFIAGDIVEVSAYANHMAFLEQPTDDCIIAQLRFESGAIGRALVSSGCKRKISTTLHIYGTAGTIDHDRIVHAAGKPKTEWDFEELPQPEIPDSILGESADFVRCIIEDTVPPVDVSDNLQTMAACFAVVASAAQGGAPVEVATWD